jgi:hypothetical protein
VDNNYRRTMNIQFASEDEVEEVSRREGIGQSRSNINGIGTSGRD